MGASIYAVHRGRTVGRHRKEFAGICLGIGVLMAFILPVELVAIVLAAVLIATAFFCRKC